MPQTAQVAQNPTRFVNRHQSSGPRPVAATSGSADLRPVLVIGPPSLSISTLWTAFRRLVHYRDLLYTLSVHRLKVRYKQSVLGPLWAVLQPLSLMLIYTAVFSRIARVPTGGTPYALFAYSA